MLLVPTVLFEYSNTVIRILYSTSNTVQQYNSTVEPVLIRIGDFILIITKIVKEYSCEYGSVPYSAVVYCTVLYYDNDIHTGTTGTVVHTVLYNTVDIYKLLYEIFE